MTSRKIQNILAALVILIALLFLIFQEKFEEVWEDTQKNDDRPVIANLETFSKNVKFRKPESLSYHKARENQALRPKDTLLTDADSTAVITFKSGLKVQLEPNSLIIIEDYTKGGAGAMELSFLRGNVKVLNQVPGVRLSGLDLNKEQVKKEPALKLDLSVLEAPPPTPAPLEIPKVDLEEKRERAKAAIAKKHIEDKETLPDSYIATIIKSQRTFLNRCYAQHLRLNPDARGRIDTSLTIEPDGSISTARVIGSTIADPGLQQCVVSTLQRARFKSFNGDPIIVNYPINFD